MVYEAGFLVASCASQRQELAELQLVMCNEADAHDEDFCGLAKASDCMFACLHVSPAAFGSSGSAAQHSSTARASSPHSKQSALHALHDCVLLRPVLPASLCCMQLCVLGPDGSLTSVYGDTTSRRLHIHNGLLLPPISINPDWFTATSKGMATLVLLDAEPDPGVNPAAAGLSNAASQAWQWEAPPQQELGRLYLRLAPAAERLLVMAAGQLFQGAVVELPQQQQSGARGKSQGAATLFCLQEVRQARKPQSSHTWPSMLVWNIAGIH